jgi:hypothetical protein
MARARRELVRIRWLAINGIHKRNPLPSPWFPYSHISKKNSSLIAIYISICSASSSLGTPNHFLTYRYCWDIFWDDSWFGKEWYLMPRYWACLPDSCPNSYRDLILRILIIWWHRLDELILRSQSVDFDYVMTQTRWINFDHQISINLLNLQ